MKPNNQHEFFNLPVVTFLIQLSHCYRVSFMIVEAQQVLYPSQVTFFIKYYCKTPPLECFNKINQGLEVYM